MAQIIDVSSRTSHTDLSAMTPPIPISVKTPVYCLWGWWNEYLLFNIVSYRCYRKYLGARYLSDDARLI